MRYALLDLRRAGKLLWVAVKYGLVPPVRDRFRPADRRQEAGVRLRLALEELGMTYLKLGQFMAMRYDVVPAEVARELHKLFERITPATFEQIRAVVEAELGGPLERFYADFQREPTAAASVAQVHEARLPDGQRVAIKVQRPGVQEIFSSDIRNFRRFAWLIDVTGMLGTLPMREMVTEFAAWTARELDFCIEGGTADRLRRNALPFEHAPLVYWELTTRRVLTMEFIDGVSLAEISRRFEAGGEELAREVLPGLDIRLVLQRASLASMRQLYVTGFFHGDPHPGNVIICRDNSFAFVDFGIFGELTNYERTTMRRLVEAISVGNVSESLRYYMKQLTPTPETDERAFREAASRVLRRWYEASRNAETAPIGERHLGKFSGEMLELVGRYRLRMNLSTLLFWRAMNALDSTALRFAEYFDLLEQLRSFFEPTPEQVVERFVSVGLDTERAVELARLLRDEPGQVGRILETLLEARHEWASGLEESGAAYRANNRRARSVALALVGLSLAVLGLAPPFDATLRAAALGLAAPLALWSLAEVSYR